MLEVNELTIEVNLKNIIDKISFVVNKNDKIAIIGEEGNGKSTLLKAIYGICKYANITGIINKKGNKIGYLEQSINDDDLNMSTYDYLFENDFDYYNHVNEFYQYVNQLNIRSDLMDVKCIRQLSGGEKVKLQLLKLLLNNPDILLLDEPTNDLDIDTLIWLENYIIHSKKPILYVSHDETLLSKTANAILHLELIKRKTVAKYTFIRTTYDDYVNERLRGIEKTEKIAKKEQQEYKKQTEKMTQIRNKVDYQLNTISRSDPHGAKLLKKKMKSIKSQEKRFEKKELTEIPDYEEHIHFFFDEVNIPNKKTILDLKDEEIKMNGNILAHHINLSVIGSEKIVIIGKNGIGKTTFLRKIYQSLLERNDLKVGYMPQDYHVILDDYHTPIDFLSQSSEKDIISLIRSYMGNMNFTTDEMEQPISNLSGGSKAKLILLKLVIEKYNVLILDEPTRNVSPLSNPVIREVLKNYKGVIISVSHDRKYINEVCDRCYELTKDGLFLVDKEKY